jgi:hypothetical protein
MGHNPVKCPFPAGAFAFDRCFSYHAVLIHHLCESQRNSNVKILILRCNNSGGENAGKGSQVGRLQRINRIQIYAEVRDRKNKD